MEQNKVYTIKLITGEELVARVNQKEDTGLVELIKPQALMMGPQGFAMAPWMMSAPDNNVLISDTTIIGATETSDMVAKQYIKKTVGIQL